MVSSRDRAGVFVDNGYLSKVPKRDFDERRIHHLKFSESICRGSERFRTYLYYCMPYQSPNPSEDERQRTS